MSKGFIPIKRSLFEHFLFKEHRAFSRFEAWLDLIQLASFTDGQTDLINGKLIIRNRGEVIASVRWLCKRWSWSIHKVSDYIELLRSQDMVTVDKENGIQKIMLVNFEKHNSIGNAEGNTEIHASTALSENQGTQTDTPKGTIGEQSGNSQDTNYKKVNKDKKEEKGDSGAGAPAPIPDEKLNEKKNQMAERQKAFYNQLIPFLKNYSKEMIRAFFNHWSEPNKSQTKMKYELETTWDLSRRLQKWEDNDRRWNKNTDAAGSNAAKEEKAAAKSFKETMQYLVSRYQENDLDERLVLPEYYDKLQVQGYMPPGTLDRYPGETVEDKKRQAVLEFIKTNANG